MRGTYLEYREEHIAKSAWWLGVWFGQCIMGLLLFAFTQHWWLATICAVAAAWLHERHNDKIHE